MHRERLSFHFLIDDPSLPMIGRTTWSLLENDGFILLKKEI
ncbi:hypothetical protein BSM4216_3655 [Bacillus smithii]|nr:hypothetical protein BSM4216_3655 [Bacillus smithii]